MPPPLKEQDCLKSTYGIRYRTDPEFRESCLARLKKKVPCPVCSKLLCKGNIKRHLKTKHDPAQST